MGPNTKDIFLGALLVVGALLAVLFFHAPVKEEPIYKEGPMNLNPAKSGKAP